MEIKTVKIEKPEDINFILGQSHFIKTVEDIHETLVGSVPGIKFGLAFCEASGKCLVRWTGTDNEMIELAKKNALAIGAGHSFILFLGPGFFPINVLNTVKALPEVARIFCATANPTEVLVANQESLQERMYQAALLKIAMKMRKEEFRGFEEIFSEILKELDLDESEFRRYVNTHMQTLMATVKQRGY